VAWRKQKRRIEQQRNVGAQSSDYLELHFVSNVMQLAGHNEIQMIAADRVFTDCWSACARSKELKVGGMEPPHRGCCASVCTF
jgi:hypothetical protein